ncbi:glucose/sorbosone family PQQ-dependent dehydrogenase [Pseudogulbenkiania subflava]|uniref:glucose/sorbosone family PQQ-dependent dehydrogenase n=1 Tax=Pseudogulbenkiania subflava TaxID=451637 RepID=UPI00190E85BD|nr:glucose/sorbosone family PQQ-dependent dehydrogenase [Pseudogulbenkiania subflava]
MAKADLPPAPGTPVPALPPHFEKAVVATGLANPHNMMLGPDGHIWLTEQIAKRITRVDPRNGKITVAVEIADAVYSPDQQDGVLGLALHPDLLKGKGRDYVYVSLTYASGQGGEFPNRTAIRRYTYNAKTQKLVSPVDILKGLPSAHDHQSARLLFGPDQKLYYSIGDQGRNQLSYLCQPNQAQLLPTEAEVKAGNREHYMGKILRMNLDGSIPADNPTIHGVKSHVYAWGIRNTQGMVFSPTGKLFATDQGPNTDDELNLILPGRNYGWPNVAGRKDDAGYAYANYSAAKGGCKGDMDNAQNGLKPPEAVPVTRESQWSDPDFVEPLKTFFSVDNNFNFNNPVCADKNLYYICWPTIAPSSIAYYRGGKQGVPGWEHSLLITSLKRGVLYRVQLDPTGTLPLGNAEPLFRSANRYREVVVSPDGRTIYVATDTSHLGTTDTGNAAFKLDNPGSIIAFKYSRAK